MALSISAQADGGYIGVGVGEATSKVDDFPAFTVVSRDEKDTAYKIFGGFEFNKNFGIELGYADFGKIHNVYSFGNTTVKADGDGHRFYTALTGALPLSDQFSLSGKLGVTVNDGSVTATGPATASDSGTKTSAIIGVGAQYYFAKNIGVGLEYEDFGKVADDVKVNLWSVSFRYKF